MASSAIVLYAATRWLQQDPVKFDDRAVKSKLIPMSDVEKHAERDDVWLVVNGRVYDFTKVIVLV